MQQVQEEITSVSFLIPAGLCHPKCSGSSSSIKLHILLKSQDSLDQVLAKLYHLSPIKAAGNVMAYAISAVDKKDLECS